MKKLLLALLVLAPAVGFAQVDIRIGIPLPTISFSAPPPLVVVSPGVQVVPNYEEEVFFVDGWYWSRHGEGWFRTRDHHGGWVGVERERVPEALVRIPRGHYRRYREAPRERVIVAPPGREVRREIREDRRERHEEREDRHEEKREEKHESKGEGKHGHEEKGRRD